MEPQEQPKATETQEKVKFPGVKAALEQPADPDTEEVLAKIINSPEGSDEETDSKGGEVINRTLEELVKELEVQNKKNEEYEETISKLEEELADVKEGLKKVEHTVNNTASVEGGSKGNSSTEEEPGGKQDSPEGPPPQEDGNTNGNGSSKGKELELYRGEKSEPPEPPEPPESSESEDEPDDLDRLKPHIPPEVYQKLVEAQDRYAEATGKGRAGFFGHFLEKSTFLKKWVPGLGRLAEKLNSAVDASELGPARDEYKKCLVEAQQAIQNSIFEKEGVTEESIEKVRIEASKFGIRFHEGLEEKIAVVRLERSGKVGKFTDWWVRQQGLGGKLKKFAVVAGVGLGIGLLGGLAAAPVAGVVVGAAAGAGIGVGVTKKRAGGHIDHEQTMTLAEQQAYEDIAKTESFGNQKIDDGEFVSANDLVGLTEDRTASERVGNRRRVKSATSAATIGAGVGASAGTAIHNALNAAPSPTHTTPDRVPNTHPDSELKGQDFIVDKGHGYTQEFSDFLSLNGQKNLTPDQYWQMYQAAVDKFGPAFINQGNGMTAYLDPGAGSWAPGVKEFLKQWMVDRSLWR